MGISLFYKPCKYLLYVVHFVNYTQGFGLRISATYGLEENTHPFLMVHTLCINGIVY